MTQYTLTISESQARIIEQALDLFSRIGMGQFENILDVYDSDLKLDLETRDALRDALKSAKHVVGHPTNGSYGIHSPKVDNQFRVAFDMQQVIRHRVAWDNNPAGGVMLSFDKPRSTSGETLAQITRVG